MIDGIGFLEFHMNDQNMDQTLGQNHSSGQIIATKPPRSPQIKWWFSKGIPPKSPKHSGLEIIVIV